jgi:hypothetical protein
MAKRKTKSLEERKAMPNNKYWRIRADEEFMVQFRGEQCEVCTALGRINTQGTVFHHIVAKAHSKALRYDKRNGLILCPSHHGFSDVMCAHSASQNVVAKFHDFCWEHFPSKMQWLEENRRINFRYTYKDAYEYMCNGSDIEYTFDTEDYPF